MRKFTPYLTAIAAAALILTMTLDYEREIESIENTIKEQSDIIDSLANNIDSLILEIDTLKWDRSIFDFDIKFNGKSLLSSIMYIESSYNDSAYNKSEDAVGCLQIRRCMVDDVNRILKRKGSYIRYEYEDRWKRSLSIKMFDIYCDHYNLSSAEEIARCWNGGPRGVTNPATVAYWNKVEKQIKENS